MALKRLIIMLINIFFPPLSMLLLCGPEIDVLINALLFICAIIPSHIHGFYISCTYFHRKRKVRRGVYPGKWRWGIYSERVQRGGASAREVERLRRQALGWNDGGQGEMSASRRSGRPCGYAGRSSVQQNTEYAGGSPIEQVGSPRSRVSGYGGLSPVQGAGSPIEQIGSSRSRVSMGGLSPVRGAASPVE